MCKSTALLKNLNSVFDSSLFKIRLKLKKLTILPHLREQRALSCQKFFLGWSSGRQVPPKPPQYHIKSTEETLKILNGRG